MADYYNVLRIGHNASRKDIAQAYERLMKESHYDSTIDKASVETAYRILSDIAAKAQYDARQTQKTKRIQNKERVSNKGSLQSIMEWFTLPHMLAVLGVLLLATAGFYWLRFGYKLKDFQAGDVLFERSKNIRYGKILRVEDHSFGSTTERAYLIEIDKSRPLVGINNRTMWVQQDVIKACCYKP